MQKVVFVLFIVHSLVLKAQDKTLETLWNDMAFSKKSSCLVGTQYSFERAGERYDATIFNSDKWKTFVDNDKNKITVLLISKLQDTTKTSVHTCPFMGASNGELAVYSLQQIHKLNWFDIQGFKAYADRDITSAIDSHQGWLLKILADDNQRKLLEDAYLAKLN